MISMRFHSYLFILFFILLFNVFAQTELYKGYQTSFPYVTTCATNSYLDVASFKCLSCPTDSQQKDGGNFSIIEINISLFTKTSTLDVTQCACLNNTYYYQVNQGGGSVRCSLCTGSYTQSSDGFGCVTPQNPTPCLSNTSYSVICNS